MKPPKRAQMVKPSPTLAITAKAVRAQGIDIISFGADEPDFDTLQHIKDAAIAALQEGFTKYSRLAVVPGVEFGVEGFLRLSYPTAPEAITEGIGRIKGALARLG
jgi:aspartate/methionine/tyrosine aminotransferase